MSADSPYFPTNSRLFSNATFAESASFSRHHSGDCLIGGREGQRIRVCARQNRTVTIGNRQINSFQGIRLRRELPHFLAQGIRGAGCGTDRKAFKANGRPCV